MAGPWEQYKSAGPWEQYGAPAPAEDAKQPKSIMRRTADELAGLVRGAGSIGATIMTSLDAAARAIGVQNSLIGRTDRREAMDAALRDLGADTGSNAFAAGKIGAEVAGTLGVGGVLGNLARAAGAAPAAVNALTSAGMTTGQALPRALDLGIRTAAGGAVGGASAALANPDDAKAGVLFGGATPGAAKLAGMAGTAVGKAMRGPQQSPQMVDAIKSAQELGLVLPPSQANPSMLNRLLEGSAGKLTTAQNASAQNAAKVNQIAARELGLPADTVLNAEVIGNVKTAAGALYDAVSSAGVVRPGASYMAALDDIAKPHVLAAKGFPKAAPSPVIDMVDSLRTEAFDAASAVSKIKELRATADKAFASRDSELGRAAKSAAKALEDALEGHLKVIGEPDLLNQFKEARKLYAKAVTVDKALNKGSGNVNAQKLAADLQKGKPLSGDLKRVAESAGQFRTAFKPVDQMGSLPQWSPLDLYGGVGSGGLLTMLTGNPAAMGMAAMPLVRMGARKAALSAPVQNRLLQSAGEDILSDQSMQQLLYRAAPQLLSGQ